jgi:hypothetical protein
MSPISRELRQYVAENAKYRCGYCQTQEAVIGMALEIEHIIPEALGGDSTEENFWLACPSCNRHKATRVKALDSETDQDVPLFDPRRQFWTDHFRWHEGGLYIVGTSPIGRATIDALHMNNPFLVRARRGWIIAGWHPPSG